MAIDYQVGDVVKVPTKLGGSLRRALVTDITEKGIVLKLIGAEVFPLLHLPHYVAESLIKDTTGTLLYGNKEK